MDELLRHNHQLTALRSDWFISHFQFAIESWTLTLSLEFVGARVVCPEFGTECAMQGHVA